MRAVSTVYIVASERGLWSFCAQEDAFDFGADFPAWEFLSIVHGNA